MREFEYKRADSFEEASSILREGGTVMAGGTDLLGCIRFWKKDRRHSSVSKELPETIRLKWTVM